MSIQIQRRHKVAAEGIESGKVVLCTRYSDSMGNFTVVRLEIEIGKREILQFLVV